MNKTQKQFLKLGDYATEVFSIDVGYIFWISDRYSIRRMDNGYNFLYYGIIVDVTEKCFRLALPKSIDIADFNKSILLHDMWADIINYKNPIQKITGKILPMFAEIFDSCGREFISLSENILQITKKEDKK